MSILCHSFLCTHPPLLLFFFFNDTATTEIYTLSLHDALPISPRRARGRRPRNHGGRPWSAAARPLPDGGAGTPHVVGRSEEHTSELQSRLHLVCRLLLEKKKKRKKKLKLIRSA